MDLLYTMYFSISAIGVRTYLMYLRGVVV